MPASSWGRSSAYMRDRPSEAASSPGASGARSGRAVSAARTIVARRSSGSVPRPSSSTMVSKVQVSPRWLQNTSSTSNGAASNRSATAATSAGATNRNTASGSTKRRISHGQAMRSILGRARVTQTVRPRLSRGGSLAAGTSGRPACFQASKPPARASAGTPSCRSQAAAPSLSFCPRWQTTTAARPAKSPAHSDAEPCGRRTEPGIRRGSAAKSSSVRTSMTAGHFGVPIRRTSFSMAMVVIDDMLRPPSVGGTRFFSMTPRGEIASPWHYLTAQRRGLSMPGDPASECRRLPLSVP